MIKDVNQIMKDGAAMKENKVRNLRGTEKKTTYKCPDDCGHQCLITITWGEKVANDTMAFECPMGRGYMYDWKEVKA